jgi:hypothetical protein
MGSLYRSYRMTGHFLEVAPEDIVSAFRKILIQCLEVDWRV